MPAITALRGIEPFAAKADTWYMLKLKVTSGEADALVQGKVWERGQKEPDEVDH